MKIINAVFCAVVFILDVQAIDFKGLFNQRIADYNAVIHEKCLQQHFFLSLDEQSVKTVIRLHAAVTENISANKMALIVRRFTGLYESIREKDMQSEQRVCVDRVYDMFLLSGTSVFVNTLISQLCNTLDALRMRLVYWREQRHNPSYYLFHKSPYAWLTGKKQIDELPTIIATLEKEERDVAMVLGKIATHMNKVNDYIDEGKVRTWIDEALAIGSLTSDRGVNTIAEGTDEFFEQQLQYALSTVDTIEQFLLEKITFTQKPHHFMQHWALYSAAAAGSLVAGMLFPDALMNIAGTMVNAAHTVAVQPVKDIAGLIVGDQQLAQKRKEEERERQEKINEIGQLSFDLASRQSKLRGLRKKLNINLQQTLTEMFKKFTDADKEEIKDWVKNLWQQNYIKFDDYTKVVGELRLNKYDAVFDVIEKVGFYKTAPQQSLGHVFTGFKVGKTITQLYSVYDAMKDYAGKIDTSVMPIAQEGVGAAADVVGLAANKTVAVVNKLDAINRWYNSTYVPRKVAALLPLGAMAFAARSAYGKYTALSCTALRSTLLSLRSLFVEHQEKFDMYAYGMMIYLLYVARRQTAVCVSTAGGVHDAVLHDLDVIGSADVSLTVKRDVIATMLDTYSFLKK